MGRNVGFCCKTDLWERAGALRVLREIMGLIGAYVTQEASLELWPLVDNLSRRLAATAQPAPDQRERLTVQAFRSEIKAFRSFQIVRALTLRSFLRGGLYAADSIHVSALTRVRYCADS
ncbi:hypothetical protein EVAR_53428_1 [Eumeta japonica]|uniref:Uncharacterized protein n=1 Tax=Eumeta variegata TaxID=151549 RepID=A0A4C1XZA3_EUMVA|nr:hypothetical protein EVAR_53428_1 [Eumeta japonica]